MKVPIKLLGFAFLVLSFTFVQAQECLQKDITYENIELLEKDSYNNDEIVKVNCQTGYNGMYKLKCVNGKWEEIIARHCSRKKCGHPGDTPNGDFKLLEGTEFVFGATVEYTCKTGYEMASRVKLRHCRSQGWDNSVPICEVVKCPAIHTEGDLTASGNMEEGSYGDVIHFECVSPDKKIDRSSDIHCKENGAWSDSVPKCIEITCTAPNIPHGRILSAKENHEEYKKDEILQYRCEKGYKSREGIPRCTKYGWSLNPECDEVTCQIKSTSYGTESIEPEGKTIFRAEETVKITCSERYWIFGIKKNTKSFTCQIDGQWDDEPTCVDIRCEVPHDRRISQPEYYFKGDLKLDAEIYYYCNSGYSKMAQKAKCTREGWKPDPLCAKITCEAPKISNAEIEGDQRENYEVSSRIVYKCHSGFKPEQRIQITCNSQGQWTGIQHCTATEVSCITPSLKNGFIYRASINEKEMFYSCNAGYKPFSGNWWESVTCNERSWSDEPQCIRKEECGAYPKVNHGKIKQTKNHDRESAEFECDPGFKSTHSSIKCVEGKWETPTCEEDVHCDIPPEVENAVIPSKPQEYYPEGSSVTYKCRNLFTMRGPSRVLCHNATWGETPKCEAFCLKPLQTVNNSFLVDKNQDKRKYSHGDTVRFECFEGFESRETTAKCDVQTWIYPKCIKKSQCSKPTKYMTFVTLLNEKNVYNNFENLSYKCKSPYDKIPEGTWTCEDKEWLGAFVCTSEICPPPPHLEHGDYTVVRMNGEVITEVYYTCKRDYVLDKQQQYCKCQNGRWETPPKCLEPCEITSDNIKKYNVQLPQEKVYIKHGEKYGLYCKSGWNIGDWRRSEHLYVSCSNGELISDKTCNTENYFV
ncbi:complement factor H-like isoform X2 [Myxocyprinus asiaticus]|uniref:complement factor H-like isoform X1 n=1 Tax=Myxocyprinus asiaticus TaxID=70543 RepID=UPI002223C682|nr:complement factor H-like isoform X1 [Myxocyprinus asiaticus]XP_051549664.1 complement factor H-like isoform X2 [Myxocyprinus asiaticus]